MLVDLWSGRRQFWATSTNENIGINDIALACGF
jgi:hypothetical protein